MPTNFQRLSADAAWCRLDREESSLMATLSAEMTDPGSTGTGVDADAISDQLWAIRQEIAEVESNA